MLHAVRQQVHSWNEQNRVAADLRVGTFAKRNDAGLAHLTWPDSIKLSLIPPIVNSAAELIPKTLRHPYNLVTESELDAILDASGFTYSDQWPTKTAERMASLSERWKNQGKKVILLPQAFGPFTKAPLVTAFREILALADLVFARDQISFDHIMKLKPPKDNVHLAPDFTNLLKGNLPDYASKLKQATYIIPNSRMMDKTGTEIAGAYMNLLEHFANSLVAMGRNPVILIHETKDTPLGKQLQQILLEQGHKLSLLEEPDPLKIKGLLGQADLVISSRFHGLVSALSQGVPSIGTGWSHKYQELFGDYHCPHCLIDTLASRKDVETLLDQLLNPETHASLKTSLQKASAEQKKLIQRMWQQIEETIRA